MEMKVQASNKITRKRKKKEEDETARKKADRSKWHVVIQE